MADNERVYVIEGEDYPSVTTILGATIAKQRFLIPWAIKGYHEQVSTWIEDKWQTYDPRQKIYTMFNDARDELMEARDTQGYKPARIGNVVHGIISQSIHAGWDGNKWLIDTVLELLDSTSHMGWTSTGDELVQMFEDEGLTFDKNMNPSEVDVNSETYNVYSCLVAWQKWLKDFEMDASGVGQRFNICETEKLVYCRDGSSEPLYAGTVDLVLLDTKQPNRRFVIDIKTGTLSDDAMYQVAAYANGLEYMALERWKDDDTKYTTDPDEILVRQENWQANSNSERWILASNNGTFMDTDEKMPEAMVDYPGVDRCFVLQLQRTAGKYVLKEAKDWKNLYHFGFKNAQEWFAYQKGHSLGRQIKPNDFLGERVEATIKEG